MKLRKTTQEIIQFVEDVSGIPVQVTEDPKLQTLANVSMARKSGLPQHLIVYRPEADKTPDYQICYQCGYIIRTFQNPPDMRFDMADTQKGKDDIDKLLQAPGGIAKEFGLRKSQLTGIRDQFLAGLIIHLRSVPVGFRVSQWLSKEYPELKELERMHVVKEIEINKQSMTGEVKKVTPQKIYDASQTISAAYAIYWSEKYNNAEWINPYQQQRYLVAGHQLIDIFKRIPESPMFDRELIEKWGEYTGIRDWFTFKAYE